ncbi:MAG TPA: hypothetical protein VFR44_14000 [Actinomycetota bacterium]|nr:hypothetical protein [Actinomycetota bacterium]
MSLLYASRWRKRASAPRGGRDQWKEPGMLDVLMVALTIVAFGAFFALIAGLERV